MVCLNVWNAPCMLYTVHRITYITIYILKNEKGILFSNTYLSHSKQLNIWGQNKSIFKLGHQFYNNFWFHDQWKTCQLFGEEMNFIFFSCVLKQVQWCIYAVRYNVHLMLHYIGSSNHTAIPICLRPSSSITKMSPNLLKCNSAFKKKKKKKKCIVCY